MMVSIKLNTPSRKIKSFWQIYFLHWMASVKKQFSLLLPGLLRQLPWNRVLVCGPWDFSGCKKQPIGFKGLSSTTRREMVVADSKGTSQWSEWGLKEETTSPKGCHQSNLESSHGNQHPGFVWYGGSWHLFEFYSQGDHHLYLSVLGDHLVIERCICKQWLVFWRPYGLLMFGVESL